MDLPSVKTLVLLGCREFKLSRDLVMVGESTDSEPELKTRWCCLEDLHYRKERGGFTSQGLGIASSQFFLNTSK